MGHVGSECVVLSYSTPLKHMILLSLTMLNKE